MRGHYRSVPMEDLIEEAEKLARPFADELGLEIVEVEYVRKHNGMNLTFFIDKEGGVTIDDCEKLHRAIDEPLDILDPTNGASYILNVSSLGIDRPLKTERDFARNAEIRLKTATGFANIAVQR